MRISLHMAFSTFSSLYETMSICLLGLRGRGRVRVRVRVRP